MGQAFVDVRKGKDSSALKGIVRSRFEQEGPVQLHGYRVSSDARSIIFDHSRIFETGYFFSALNPCQAAHPLLF